MNQCSALNLRLRIVACYELSPVTNFPLTLLFYLEFLYNFVQDRYSTSFQNEDLIPVAPVRHTSQLPPKLKHYPNRLNLVTTRRDQLQLEKRSCLILSISSFCSFSYFFFKINPSGRIFGSVLSVCESMRVQRSIQ